MFSKEASNSRDGRESRRGFRDERYVCGRGTNAVACPPASAGSSSGSHLRRELPILPELTEEEAEVFGTDERNYRKFSRLDDILVRVNGEDLPPYLECGFGQCSFDEALRQNMHKAGVFWPSPVQRYAIPGLLAGRDLYVVSETNAGKIAAFVLPMVQLVLAQEVLELTAPQPYVIIVTPTRRTAAKTYAEARKFAYGTPVKVCVVDSTFVDQQREIASGCHILVVTPGWLIHLKTIGTVAFRNVKAVVLHEADQIIQLGLRTAIEFLMNDPTLPANRQTVIYSLSMNGLVHDLAVEYLTRPISVIVKVVGGTSQDILQTIHRVCEIPIAEP
ncbi:ATP-dependent RNA helicase vasa-like [Anopheles ziemanni]|uniref:ATP-dependent RNA helicase vasa-like n=1 Tax=Anopheles coustani TaxID=139045 RepID=UPI0026593EAD|nr:ATP-dependent RNA helicase vasa-like [Anopheles coustani]XP_058176191.1 ATP-dependent RNA helicase vasa-like [Anopheles ziemanni]